MKVFRPDKIEVVGDKLMLTFGIDCFGVELGEIENRLRCSSMSEPEVVLAIAKELYRAGKGVEDAVSVISESGVIL